MPAPSLAPHGTGWWRFTGVDAQRILREEFDIECSLSEHLSPAASDAIELVGAAVAPSPAPTRRRRRRFRNSGLAIRASPGGAGTRNASSSCGSPGRGADRPEKHPDSGYCRGQTGGRPAAAKDLGFTSAYVFGAVCPGEGKAAAVIMPICNTIAMNHHLREISSQVGTAAHALLVLTPAPAEAGVAPAGNFDSQALAIPEQH